MCKLRWISVVVMFLAGIMGLLLAVMVLAGSVESARAQTATTQAVLASEPASSSAPATTRAAATATAASGGVSSGDAAEPLVGRDGLGPMLLAGDRHFLWMLQPKLVGDKEKVKGFALWLHRAGSKEEGRDKWVAVTIDDKSVFPFPGTIAGLGVLWSDPAGKQDAAAYSMTNAVLLSGSGELAAFSRNDRRSLPNLPVKATPMGLAASGSGSVVVLSRGLATPTSRGGGGAATGSAPATNGSERGGELWYVHQFMGGKWTALPVLGRVGEAGAPSEKARPAVVYQGNRVWVMWHEPETASVLHVRRLEMPPVAGGWSGETTSRLAEPAGPMGRLQGLAVDSTVYVFWAQRPAGGGMMLRGGAVTADGKMEPGGMLPGMDIGAIADGADADTDVAVAAESNSLFVAAEKEGKVRSMLFDLRSGRAVGEQAAVEVAAGPGRESVILQYLALILLVVLLVLSMWQWRTKPMMPRVPKGMRVAYLSERVVAGAIDAALPLVAVIVVSGLYRDGGLWNLWGRWWEAVRHPQMWWESRDLMWFMAGYIGHVMVGELLAGRSVGKSIMGLRVQAMDGTRAGPLAIVLRNLVRISELTFPPLLAYVLLNGLRQRLGDLLARTMVVRVE